MSSALSPNGSCPNAAIPENLPIPTNLTSSQSQHIISQHATRILGFTIPSGTAPVVRGAPVGCIHDRPWWSACVTEWQVPLLFSLAARLLIHLLANQAFY